MEGASSCGHSEPATESSVEPPRSTSAPSKKGLPSSISFDSIVGNSTVKRTLFEHVVLPLKLSEEARSSLFGGIRSSGNNVLLHGPPGTGKTTIAQAASHEAGASFFSVTPSSVLSKYQGESERVVSRLFNEAKKAVPSIIFFDEVDALAPSRDAQEDVQSRRLLAELLLQTSDLGSSERVVVIGATNRIDDVDVALLRRFQSRVFVGPPTAAERVEMIESFMRGVEHELNRRQLETLSDRLLGWSGSDIKSLCREACMGPLRSWYEQEEELEKAVLRRQSEGGPLLRPVHMADFEKAYSFLMGSSSAVPSCERSPSSTRDEHMDGELDASMPAHEEGHHDSLCEPHVEATLSQEAKSTDGLDE